MLIVISLMIFVSVFLNTRVESFYFSTFKQQIEIGFDATNWGANPTLDDMTTVLEHNNGKISFAIIGEFRSYTILNRKTSKIENSSAPEYSKDPNKFETEIFMSDNLMAALGGKLGDKEKKTSVGNSVFFDYAKPIGDYVLYFRYNQDEWIGVIQSFKQIILTISLIAIMASMVLGFILSKTITVPIVNIMHKAQQIAEGDFDQVLEVKANDEIGMLTNNFNYMARELKNKIIEISSEKSKVETILNYMTDGVIAFNLEGEVIHSNPASKRILNVNEFSDTFDEFSKKYGLGISLGELLYLELLSEREKNVKINETFIRIYFATFTDEDKKAEGIIAVLQDITDQQRLDDMRREFVANVSHELRTPLTSIKSYTETLLDGALDDRETAEKFLKVINSESDRMTRLVKDLLQLSRLDNRRMEWNMQEISFVNLAKNAIEKLELEAKNKGQTLESYVIGDIPEIKADKDRIEQVILNILSNAMKYTPTNGKITAYIGKMFSDVYIKVIDNGIGIPSQDMPRIFERFYRVDKARSREMGGTGLGLSIAKEIVEAHGGTITITSEVGKGTEVTVRLPIVTES